MWKTLYIHCCYCGVRTRETWCDDDVCPCTGCPDDWVDGVNLCGCPCFCMRYVKRVVACTCPCVCMPVGDEAWFCKHCRVDAAMNQPDEYVSRDEQGGPPHFSDDSEDEALWETAFAQTQQLEREKDQRRRVYKRAKKDGASAAELSAMKTEFKSVARARSSSLKEAQEFSAKFIRDRVIIKEQGLVTLIVCFL